MKGTQADTAVCATWAGCFQLPVKVAGTMVIRMYQVSREHDDCGATQLDVCPRMAVSLSGIFQAPYLSRN